MAGDHTSVIYGTHYPNRLFVGCLPSNAKPDELGEYFSKYGEVVEAKIVLDSKGNSKKFGFVEFTKPDFVEKVILRKDEVVFKGKKINVGPAVKKNMDQNGESNKTTPTKQPQTKTVIMPGSNIQFPKTIIRKSPTENIESNFDFALDRTFCSLWGISHAVNSVWAIRPRSNDVVTPDIQAEKPFSMLNQLRNGERSNLGGFQPAPSYSNAVRAPSEEYYGFNNTLQ